MQADSDYEEYDNEEGRFEDMEPVEGPQAEPPEPAAQNGQTELLEYMTDYDEEARDRFNDEPTLLEVLSEDGEYEEEPIDIDEAEDVPPQVLRRR